VARKLLYFALAGLFVYKALQEAHGDPLWSPIYVLVSLEYLVEGRSH